MLIPNREFEGEMITIGFPIDCRLLTDCSRPASQPTRHCQMAYWRINFDSSRQAPQSCYPFTTSKTSLPATTMGVILALLSEIQWRGRKIHFSLQGQWWRWEQRSGILVGPIFPFKGSRLPTLIPTRQCHPKPVQGFERRIPTLYRFARLR